ncbi:MAG: ABC transporter ATP-binding protein [Spirochaetia bacterium]|nr:ABC transporter ATP-binding protein [Spirochaetia bacterium]
MDAENVIEITELSKQYPNGKLAVDSLSLNIKRGEVFGVLGPNGSGKTTTILMLLGLTEPSGGRASILGLDPLRSPLEIKRKVGYMPDTVGFYDELSGYENIDYTARFMDFSAEERTRRMQESLEKMRLTKSMHEKVRTYSHGMRRRLGLAEVLVKQPEIAILDEPTQGLDPESAAEFLELISTLNRDENLTILLSSHLLNQVQAVCDRVGLFSNGKMLISGSVDELSRQIIGGQYTVSVIAAGSGLRDILSGIEGVQSVEQAEDWTYRIECESDVRAPLAAAITASGGQLFELSMQQHSLDSIYKTYFKEAANADTSA